MQNRFADIVLFSFNRPNHLKECLTAIKDSTPGKRKVYIFQDVTNKEASKNFKNDVLNSIEICNEFAKQNNIILNVRSNHLGLRQNIIQGISEVSKLSSNMIIIEDDIIIDEKFLVAFENALNDYQTFPSDGLFHFQCKLRGEGSKLVNYDDMSCWGWGIRSKDWPGADILKLGPNPGLKYLFQFNGKFSSDRLWQIVTNLIDKKQTWAVFWAYFLYKNKAEIITLNDAVAENVGLVGLGTNNGLLSPGVAKNFLIKFFKLALALTYLKLYWKANVE